jgi:arsenical pump membrane protein
VEQAIAYSTLAITISLAVSRPRLGLSGLRVTPGGAAIVGVLLLFLTGILSVPDLVLSARLQWRPLLALTSIMIMAGLVQESRVLERLAASIEQLALRSSAHVVFATTFGACFVVAALLNNDAEILLMTPFAVVLARRLYPGQPRIHLAFAFAVFQAPGIAPFYTSNPMNMLVAEYGGLSFNDYTRWMLLPSLVASVLTFSASWLYFRKDLASARQRVQEPLAPSPQRGQSIALALLVGVFLSYPIIAWLKGPVWGVSVAGAVLALLVARQTRIAPPRRIVRHVSLDILLFLWGVFVVVGGLREVGVVDQLSWVYELAPASSASHTVLVGGVSAVGSALIDNHPMSILNLMALGSTSEPRALMAALVGGDLGPRLLPIGSLAGLLWIAILRRLDVVVPLRTFVAVGALTMVPALLAGLVTLHFW